MTSDHYASAFVVPRQQATTGKVASPTSSFSTQLFLKVKVDPKAASNKNKINPGAFKGAAYGGSIAVAVLLPVAFLVWAAAH
mmetsp:Transcript_18235/g.29428  ORF Transcript_18235/g.29428 Transcript_18235/m.29428 type:complete len:82 (-) Transcript_18235:153-398(-)